MDQLNAIITALLGSIGGPWGMLIGVFVMLFLNRFRSGSFLPKASAPDPVKDAIISLIHATPTPATPAPVVPASQSHPLAGFLRQLLTGGAPASGS